ncbi:hypothetical protein CR513_35232, partial [Mucuna pruriens]
MEATYIFLRRSWQYDRRVTYNGVTNEFSFEHMGQKVLLKPLSPREASMEKLLEELKDVFPKDVPHGVATLEILYWELKVMQNLDYLDCDNYTNVKLIALSFESYCRGLRRASIKPWKELKKEMPDLFVKLQKMYQGLRSIDEYFKQMEVALIRA